MFGKWGIPIRVWRAYRRYRYWRREAPPRAAAKIIAYLRARYHLEWCRGCLVDMSDEQVMFFPSDDIASHDPEDGAPVKPVCRKCYHDDNICTVERREPDGSCTFAEAEADA